MSQTAGVVDVDTSLDASYDESTYQSTIELLKMRISKRTRRGNTIAEAPAFMYFLFVGIALPMIAFASLFYRGLFFYFAVRDSVNQAAKCSSYTTDVTTSTPPVLSAQTTAKNIFANDMAAWKAFTGTLSIAIVTKPLSAANSPAPSTTKLAAGSVNTNTNMYFIRGTGLGQIEPVFGGGGKYMGLNIPGLTASFPLSVVVDAYVENPQGLTN